MDYQYLLYFIKIAECKNISKAAEKLFVSQQALSKALRSIENELGVELFTRSRSGVELTDYGQGFLSYALSSVKRRDSLLDQIGRLKNGKEDDSVHFAYDAGLLRQLPKGFLPGFMSSHPDTGFFTYSYHADYYNRATIPDSMNVLLTSTPPDNLAFETYYKCSLDVMALLHRQNPLAQKESLSWSDLKSVPLVHINIENSFSRSIESIFKLNSIRPRYIIDPAEIDFLFYLCEKQNAVTVFSSRKSLIPGWGVLRPFESRGFTMDIYICTRRDIKLSRSEKELVSLMISALKSN